MGFYTRSFSCRWFSIAAFSAAMEKDILLRVLCVLSEAGGEKHTRTYPHSKSGIILACGKI